MPGLSRMMQAAASAAGFWYLAGGSPVPECAYQPKDAASLADSYNNLPTPGVNNAAPGVAPTWDAVNGWSWNGTTQYLTTGIVPDNDQTWTMLVEFSNGSGTALRSLGGSFATGRGIYMHNITNTGATATWSNKMSDSASPALTSGIMAIAGQRIYRNAYGEGMAVTEGTGTSVLPAVYIGALNNNGTAAGFNNGSFQRFGLWSAPLTPYQIARMYNAIRGDTMPLHLVVCEGDSLTRGFGITDLVGCYPAQLSAGLGATYSVNNVGNESETIDNMTTDAAVTDALIVGSWTKKILVVWAGTNDMYFGQPGAGAYADYAAYCAARQAAGWQVVAMTALPRSGVGTPGDFETQRGTFNSSVVANWATFADALADVAANSTIGDAGDELNTTYYNADKVHMTVAGFAIVAGIVQTAIGTL